MELTTVRTITAIFFYPINCARHYSKNFTWISSLYSYVVPMKVGSSYPLYTMMLKTNVSGTCPGSYSGP